MQHLFNNFLLLQIGTSGAGGGGLSWLWDHCTTFFQKMQHLYFNFYSFFYFLLVYIFLTIFIIHMLYISPAEKGAEGTKKRAFQPKDCKACYNSFFRKGRGVKSKGQDDPRRVVLPFAFGFLCPLIPLNFAAPPGYWSVPPPQARSSPAPRSRRRWSRPFSYRIDGSGKGSRKIPF